MRVIQAASVKGGPQISEHFLFLREHLSSPDTFMVGGESGEVDLAVMGNCHASIIGGGYHE